MTDRAELPPLQRWSLDKSAPGLFINARGGYVKWSDAEAALATQAAEIERLRAALRNIADAADAVGVRYFDSDDQSDEVNAMLAATDQRPRSSAQRRPRTEGGRLMDSVLVIESNISWQARLLRDAIEHAQSSDTVSEETLDLVGALGGRVSAVQDKPQLVALYLVTLLLTQR